MSLPAWKERQIRKTELPLRQLTHVQAVDLLSKMHKRVDSVRWQLWHQQQEIERTIVKLQMGNPNAPRPQILQKKKPFGFQVFNSRKGATAGCLTGKTKESKMEIGQYVIVRTHSAGVHAGTLKAREGKEAVLTDARRLWFWSGAFTLNDVANKGIGEGSKIPSAVPEITLTEAIEIIPCTDAAKKSIVEFPEHKI